MLNRFTGVSFVAAGVVFLAGGAMHPSDSGTGSKVEQLHEMLVDANWYPSHALLAVAIALFTVGIALLRRREHERGTSRLLNVAVVVGVIAMVLGVLFQKLNVSFLVGWAFNVAASANLPALVMLLFWKRTTKQGITAAIVVGLLSSLTWLLLSAPAFRDVYRLDPARAPVPFSQPGIVTIPLGFVVLVAVSLLTSRRREGPPKRGFEVVQAGTAQAGS